MTTTATLDWRRAQAYLAERGHDLALDAAPRRLSGGFANLNYLVYFDGAPAVLRRPPHGEIPPGAHDMGREHRILARLHEAFPLAPRGLLLCDDPAILGAPFQLLEYREGVTIEASLPATLDDPERLAADLGAMMIEVLAELHRVDPAAVGLDTLGRPAGFLERAVRGWLRRARLCFATFDDGVPASVERLAVWLGDNQVPDRACDLLHNDFKLNNILLDRDTYAPVAVLDWDQGTRGDGLFDLATLLSYWTEDGDPPAMHAIAQMPTAAPGFPTREAAARRYSELSGRDLSDFRFHRVLGQLKTAVIFAQLYARWRGGGTDDPKYAEFGPLALGLLDVAEEIARGLRF
ncbi:MAG: phosphotransferase family protein [Myxococcales bacterium]|nr:phosphotransferase family protein [Myxococcales bacterium]